MAAALSGNGKANMQLLGWQNWPEMPAKGDVSDWLAHGGTVERLYALAEQCRDAGKQRKRWRL